MINRFRSVPVILMVTSIIHLILFTSFLQVTLATVDDGSGSALKSVSNGDGNVGLVSLGNMNFAKQSAYEKCPVKDIEKRCAKKAEDTAKINGYDDPEKLIRKLASLINDTSTETDGCEGWKEFFKCIAEEFCQYCDYLDALSTDVLANTKLMDFEKICDYEFLPTPFCRPEEWKKYHNKPYPGECVLAGEKFKCAQQINPGVTSWDKELYIILGNTLTDKYKKYCPQMLEIAKCELAAGCSTCNENEEKNIGNLFQTWFSQTNCSEVDGINKTAFHVDCSKATTEKPDPTKPTDKPDPSKSTSKPNPNRSTKSAKTSSSTSGSKTVIIVVSVVAVILLIIAGGIIAYCCLCSGKGQKKNAAGKLQTGQKMAAKGAPSSKVGNSEKSGLGKSSSSKRRGAAAPPSKSQISAAPSNSQSGAGGPKVSSNSQMGVSKSKV